MEMAPTLNGIRGEPDAGLRYEILGYDELPVASIRPNPRNPRPKYHLADDDPKVLALGDSIRATGQHRPALVYELKGHPTYPDEIGQFMLLQGERRWRACKLADIDILRCFIARTPQTPDEEESWLGNEEAFKEDWGQFFVLRYAHELATLMNVPMPHQDIVARTGLTLEQLRNGEKMFGLAPEIQALVAEYEELLYASRLDTTRKKHGRIGNKAGVDTGEFSVAKAAVVYDIFTLLRTHLTNYCKQFDDAELQRRVAAKRASLADLESLRGLLRHEGANPQPGLMTKLDKFLQDKEYKATALLRAAGATDSVKLQKLIRRIEELDHQAYQLGSNPGQLGANREELEDASRILLRALSSLGLLERMVSGRASELGGSRG